MVQREAVRTVIGIIGTLNLQVAWSSTVLGLLGFTDIGETYKQIIKRKDVEEYSPWPALFTVLNCAMWVFYGMPFVHPHSTLVYTINGIGCVIELSYLIIYVIYANKKQRRLLGSAFALVLAFFVLVVVLIMLLLHTTSKRSLPTGIICVVLNICMYASPVFAARKVIKTKSVEYYGFWLLVANFSNGLIWVVYALLRFDLYLTISNGCGAVFGLAQLILYWCYYKSTPKGPDGGSNKNRAEVQLTKSDVKSLPI
ncbi:hypothetical protein IFM89_036012 [Coptis chinensis]|uniref:Bidirectional sugar transporter SWEET n=1 Tax=Coptis chinensis TaxID=261450 RepID=A0A835IST8_9MAGN|nr:hypothetical protein IFM89_036012 [Coptis chinensis]